MPCRNPAKSPLEWQNNRKNVLKWDGAGAKRVYPQMAALSELTIAALLGGREHAQDGSPQTACCGSGRRKEVLYHL